MDTPSSPATGMTFCAPDQSGLRSLTALRRAGGRSWSPAAYPNSMP